MSNVYDIKTKKQLDEGEIIKRSTKSKYDPFTHKFTAESMVDKQPRVRKKTNRVIACSEKSFERVKAMFPKRHVIFTQFFSDDDRVIYSGAYDEPRVLFLSTNMVYKLEGKHPNRRHVPLRRQLIKKSA